MARTNFMSRYLFRSVVIKKFVFLFILVSVIGRFQIGDKWVNAKKGQEKKKERKCTLLF